MDEKATVTLSLKHAFLQFALLMMFAASMALMNDLLDPKSWGGLQRYAVLLIFPVLPWCMLASALRQHRLNLMRDV